jgi:Anti-sigma-28 factor, FlgM
VHDVDESSFAIRWTGSLESDGLSMLSVDDPARPARVALVRDAVAAGHYRPPADAVAERLLAFLAPAWGPEGPGT